MTRAPWFNSGLQRLTGSLGRQRQCGDRLDLSVFWLYGLLWVLSFLAVILFERLLSPAGNYYGAWLFTYGPALPGFYVLQREFRPGILQFGMTRSQVRSRRVLTWSSIALFVSVLWFGILYWVAADADAAMHSIPAASPVQAGGQNLLSCSHPIFATFMGVLAAPVIEEFVFRGYFYLVLRQNKGGSFAALASSAVFAILHGPNAPVAFAQSLLYVYFDNQAGSLCPSMIGHAAWNGALLLTCMH